MKFCKTKRLFLTFLASFLMILSSTEVDAQYKLNKEIYDSHKYTSDMGGPYDPVIAGVISLIPGVGQMYAHEYRRGMSFILGEIGSYLVAVSGLAIGYSSESQIGAIIGITMMLGGALTFVSLPIWSAFDAVKVAKVNNMAWAEKQQSGAVMRLNPRIQVLPENKVAPGLSLTLNF